MLQKSLIWQLPDKHPLPQGPAPLRHTTVSPPRRAVPARLRSAQPSHLAVLTRKVAVREGRTGPCDAPSLVAEVIA